MPRPRAQAIAIGGDKIIGIGTRRELEPMRGPSTKIIDAGGRTVVPELNDAHTHFIRGGLTYSQEVRWDGVSSLALALRMLKDQAQRSNEIAYSADPSGQFDPSRASE